MQEICNILIEIDKSLDPTFNAQPVMIHEYLGLSIYQPPMSGLVQDIQQMPTGERKSPFSSSPSSSSPQDDGFWDQQDRQFREAALDALNRRGVVQDSLGVLTAACSSSYSSSFVGCMTGNHDTAMEEGDEADEEDEKGGGSRVRVEGGTTVRNVLYPPQVKSLQLLARCYSVVTERGPRAIYVNDFLKPLVEAEAKVKAKIKARSNSGNTAATWWKSNTKGDDTDGTGGGGRLEAGSPADGAGQVRRKWLEKMCTDA